MKYSISEDKRRLLIHADEQDKLNILEWSEYGQNPETDCLQELVANSDLDWIDPIGMKRAAPRANGGALWIIR
jgi:hypothetical protein